MLVNRRSFTEATTSVSVLLSTPYSVLSVATNARAAAEGADSGRVQAPRKEAGTAKVSSMRAANGLPDDADSCVSRRTCAGERSGVAGGEDGTSGFSGSWYGVSPSGPFGGGVAVPCNGPSCAGGLAFPSPSGEPGGKLAVVLPVAVSDPAPAALKEGDEIVSSAGNALSSSSGASSGGAQLDAIEATSNESKANLVWFVMGVCLVISRSFCRSRAAAKCRRCTSG